MNKQITSFTLLLIALIIGGYFFFTSSDDSLSSKEARNFALKGDSEINKIFLANKTGAKVILTKEGEIWRVNGQYVARNFRIQALLKTAREIQVKQRVPKAQQERILKNLATNNIKVEFYTNDDLIKSYFIGSADGTTTGTYMLLIDEDSGENYPTPFLTHLPGFEGYLTPRYEPDPSTWRDLNIFYFPKNAIQSVKLDYPSEPEKSFEIKLNEAGYDVFQNNIKQNSNLPKIKQYLLNFKSIAAESLLKQSVRDSLQKEIKKESPWFTIEVTNLLGKTTKVKGYKKKMPIGSTNSIGLPMLYDPDRFYAECFDNELGLLQHYVFQPLLISKSDLE